jgi:[protein-PII] uridylyltransferase
VKKLVRRITSGHIDKTEFERIFEAMSTRYKLNTPSGDMVRHLELVKKLEKAARNNGSPSFVIEFNEDRHGGFWKLNFVAKDRPGLFSDLAGVLALNNINILSSNIYTWADGTALDIFSVTRPLDSINPEAIWKRVKKDLENCFSGKLALPYRLSQKSIPSIASIPKRPFLPPDVIIDNRSSDFFTLVEVFASDRVGLLYLITRTLFDLRLDIRIAKTGVKGDQIADVFYIRDLEGQKIEDQEQVNEIKRALLHQLSKE